MSQVAKALKNIFRYKYTRKDKVRKIVRSTTDATCKVNNSELLVTAFVTETFDAPKTCDVNSFRCLIEDFMLVKSGEVLLLLVPKKHEQLCQYWDEEIKRTKYMNVNICGKDYFQVIVIVASTPSRHIATNGIEVSKIKRLFTSDQSGAYVQSPTASNRKLLTWQVVIEGKMDGLQVWKKGVQKRNVFDILEHKTSKREIYLIFHLLYHEAYGDLGQCHSLKDDYNRSVIKLQTKEIKSLTEKFNEVNQMTEPFTGDKFILVLKEIDETFKSACIQCYSEFNSFNEPIVPQNKMKELMTYYMNTLPSYHKLLSQILTFDKKKKKKKNKHLVDKNYYDLLIFYQFLSLARIRNSQMCVWWALVQSASEYGRGATSYKNSSGIYFGTSVSRSTLFNKLDPLSASMNARVKALLQKKNVFVATLDNNQKGYPIKNPRYGMNNKFVKVTGRTFYDVYTTDFKSDESFRCEITYYNQDIISVLKQPHFENIFQDNALNHDKLVETFKNIDYVPKMGREIDTTGKRVNAYIEIVKISHHLKSAWKYMSGYNKTEDTYKVWGCQLDRFANSALRKSIMRRNSGVKLDFLNTAIDLPSEVTSLWNPKTDMVTRVLIPEVSLEDEISNEGYKKALRELLVLTSIMNESHYQNSKGVCVKKWALANDWNKKKIYLCMDGLSLERHRTLQKKLSNEPISFTKAYEQSVDFKKALGQIIEIYGPLHMAFHMLQCIFIIYGNFLKNIQTVLKWKRLKFKNVSETFRGCKTMVFLALEEAERLMWDLFLEEKSDTVKALMVVSEDENFCVSLAIEYGCFIKDVVQKSTDQRRQMLASFIITCNEFRTYWMSIRNGDRIYQEYSMLQFLGVFMLLKKHVYVELCLRSIEREYGVISYKELNDIRINSCVRYRIGKDQNGQVNTAVALDEYQETINGRTKKITMSSDEDSWKKHSPNVMIASKCMEFTNEEYKHYYLYANNPNDSTDEDFRGRRSYNLKTKIPRSIVERTRLYEYFTYVFEEEVPQRKYDNNDVRKIIDSLTTDLEETKTGAEIDTESNQDFDNDSLKNNPDISGLNSFEEDTIAANEDKEDVIDDEEDVSNDEEDAEIISDSNNPPSNKEDQEKHKLCFSDVFKMGQEAIESADFQKKRLEKIKGIKEQKTF